MYCIWLIMAEAGWNKYQTVPLHRELAAVLRCWQCYRHTALCISPLLIDKFGPWQMKSSRREKESGWREPTTCRPIFSAAEGFFSNKSPQRRKNHLNFLCQRQQTGTTGWHNAQKCLKIKPARLHFILKTVGQLEMVEAHHPWTTAVQSICILKSFDKWCLLIILMPSHEKETMNKFKIAVN